MKHKVKAKPINDEDARKMVKRLLDFEIPSNLEKYTTGTGQTVHVHPASDCEGTYCCIHNPSDHIMKDWPTHWRQDRGIMERLCECGVGHPDPDDMDFKERMAEKFGRESYDNGVHGCCGCCTGRKLGK